MSVLQRWIDRVAVTGRGGARVRIRPDGTGAIVGRTPGLPSARLLREVRELAPGPGTVDVFREAGRLRVTGKGALDDAGFLQRLRNVLGTIDAPVARPAGNRRA